MGEPPDLSTIHFPSDYKESKIPLGDTLRSVDKKLNAMDIFRNGTSGMWMLHFHKSGGTMLGKISHMVSSYYGGGWEKPETNWLSFRHQVVYNILKDTRPDWFSVTALRNPIMKLLSRYDFEERWGGQFGIPNNETVIFNTNTFENAVAKYMKDRRFYNHAAKVLGCNSWDCVVDR
eukprot:UN23529